MASGDVAASFGFTQVAATEDIRLAYARINDAADFAAKYGKLRFPSFASLNGFTTAGIGQLATDTSTGDDYRWSGTAWQLWSTSRWITYTPTFSNSFTPGAGATQEYNYRMQDGMCHTTAHIVLGTSPSYSGAFIYSLPLSAPGTGHQFQSRGKITMGGTTYPVFPELNAGTNIRLKALTATATLVDVTATVPAAPVAGGSIDVAILHRTF